MDSVNPVLKFASYILVHAPDMLMHNGTTQTMERLLNPGSQYLKTISASLRGFEEAVSYAPNQVYIGNITPDELRDVTKPWYDSKTGGGRFGKYGEIMPQDEFIALMKLADAFGLVNLTPGFTASVKEKLQKHPLLSGLANGLAGSGDVTALVEDGAEAIYNEGVPVGCVKKAHDVDPNLSAHVLFENIVTKASGALALMHLIEKSGIDAGDIDYIIECSEEACGDMNQRGGGNFAKAIAESAGAVNATGADTRGFCAAPMHAIIQAAALVKSGTFKNVAVVAGGATAKLGMNGKDHVKKGMPILEDVLGGFAALISEDDFTSPVFNTDVVGRHTVGTGSAPQAVMTSLVAAPLSRNGMKITDIDRYSVEMQNPEVTKPAGAGDVPEANYKMIAALAVMRKELERAEISGFIERHGMVGWAPTQGHIPSGVPYLGFAIADLTTGSLNRTMIIGKGSLFLGRMTNQFDGVSMLLERNTGKRIETSIETKSIRIGLTLTGSELGETELVKAAEKAARENENIHVVLIGPKKETFLEVVETDDAHKEMEGLLDSGALDGCVTMHYNFPIGVSTIGRVVTPAFGNEMLLASTTGASAADRVEAMVKSAIGGIAVAKALGVPKPSVGILNLDGARLVERELKSLKENGYGISFAESEREDGGVIMRGNDLLRGNVDVMVTDSLTGNIMMKVFSAYTTGGAYESLGYGYGPGVGKGYERLVLIVSRASGAAVVANAINYAAMLAKAGLMKHVKAEFQAAEKAGLKSNKEKPVQAAPDAEPRVAFPKEITNGEKPVQAVPDAEPRVTLPKEITDGEIPGIDILELEEAVNCLHKEGIYAESGMGCTGPVVMVAALRLDTAREVLHENKFL